MHPVYHKMTGFALLAALTLHGGAGGIASIVQADPATPPIVELTPATDDLWVDGQNGDDDNDGSTPSTAVRTIQKGADLAVAGTTVHILPAVYRESVRPAASGSSSTPITYVAENGPGTVILRGSEASSSVSWTPLSSNTIGLPPGVDPGDVYYTTLAGGAPRFVVELDGGGNVVARLPLAREPDERVDTEWKHHQFWWTADGGWDTAGCDPASDPDAHCDFSWRSTTQLTDRTNDTAPTGVEAGNLTTLGNLVGGTLVAMDTKQGHYVYRRTITGHDAGNGRITVGAPCMQDGGASDPGLGWGTKYYVEGRPALLDQPGEWWYDPTSQRLYLWPPAAGSPASQTIEISRREHGFDLTDRSYVTLDGLTIEFFNANSVDQQNYWAEKSHGNTVRNATLRYANQGVLIEQTVRSDQPAENVTRDFTLEQSEIAHMDTHGLFVTSWWDGAPNPDTFPRAGVYDVLIRGNEIHHLAFQTDKDDAIGLMVQFPHRFRFEDNHVHHVAHNGMQLLWSVIQSTKSRDFSSSEIKTGQILIQDNVFEKACQLTTDCGGLKVWGASPDNHVYRDLLVTGNVFRNVLAWSYVSQAREDWWTGGDGCQVQGMGGFGLYVDQASGVHAYRNVAYNNAYAGFMFSGTWRDGDMLFYNNVAANSLYGFRPSGMAPEESVNTQIVNNIIVGNEGYGIYHCDDDGSFGNTTIDHNLYYNNGWRAYGDGGVYKPGAMTLRLGYSSQSYYQTVPEIRAGTPWEDHGLEGDPGFWEYDPDDHVIDDGSWPDFHLDPVTTPVIDEGTASLPASLAALVSAFGVTDPIYGTALDIGRYEGGFSVVPDVGTSGVEPGGTTRFTLRIYPSDLPYTVTLGVTNPSPDLVIDLQPTVLAPGMTATLTVTDTHTPPLSVPGLWYTIPVTAAGEGFEQTTEINVLVGGTQVYLPLVAKEQ